MGKGREVVNSEEKGMGGEGSFRRGLVKNCRAKKAGSMNGLHRQQGDSWQWQAPKV